MWFVVLGLGLCVGTPISPDPASSAIVEPTFLMVRSHISSVGWSNAWDVLNNKHIVYTTCSDDGKSVVATKAGYLKSVDLSNSRRGITVEWLSGGNGISGYSICNSHLFTDASAAVEFGCTLVNPGKIYTRERKYDGIDHLAGWVDPHTHMFAQLGFGGRFLFGAATGPISEALAPCDGKSTHGAGQVGNLTPEELIFEGIVQGNFELDTHATGTLGYPSFTNWPRWNDLAHQQMYVDWLRKAHDDGLQLIVMSAVNNDLLCELLTLFKIESMAGHGDCSDESNLFDQIEATHSLVASNGDWMGLALTPQDAVELVSHGKLAVVLGIESSDSFGRVPLGTDDEVRQFIADKVDRFYDKGVRSFQIVHEFNNDFSGAALHHEMLIAGNKLMVARDKWTAATKGFSHGYEATPQLLEIIRETLSELSVPSANIELALASPVNAAVTISKIFSGTTDWFNRQQQLGSVRAEMDVVNNGLGPGTVSNGVGLTKSGRILVEYLFNKPYVLLDQAHLSAQASAELDLIAKSSNDYPAFVSHASLLTPFSVDNIGDFTVTHSILHSVLRTGGFLGFRTLPVDAKSFLFTSVPNDCPGSIKSWLQHLQMLQVFDTPLSLSSDFNGMALNLAPRFGLANETCAQFWEQEGCLKKNSTTCDRLKAERDAFQLAQGKREERGTGTTYDVKGFASIEFEGAVLADADQLGVQTRDIRLSVRDFISMWLRASDRNRQPLPTSDHVPSPEVVRAAMECAIGWPTVTDAILPETK